MLDSEQSQATVTLCQCGCGQRVKTSMSNGRPVLYKPGHHKVKGGTPHHSEILVCPTCQKEFQRGSRHKYCSRECYWKARGALYVEGRSSKAGNKGALPRDAFRVVSSPRIQRLYLLKQQGYCCVCGWGRIKEVLEVHHVNHNKRDGQLSNLMLLCPTCHEVRHFEEKSGRHDVERYKRATALRKQLGLPCLPKAQARTALQELVEENRINIA